MSLVLTEGYNVMFNNWGINWHLKISDAIDEGFSLTYVAITEFCIYLGYTAKRPDGRRWSLTEEGKV